MACTFSRKLALAFLLGMLAVSAGYYPPTKTTFHTGSAEATVYSVELRLEARTPSRINDLLNETDIYARSINYTRIFSAAYKPALSSVAASRTYHWINNEPKGEDDFDSLEISFSARAGDNVANVAFDDYGGLHAITTQYAGGAFRTLLAERYPEVVVTLTSPSTLGR